MQGTLALELTWTIVPLAISLVIFAWGARLYLDQRRPPARALEEAILQETSDPGLDSEVASAESLLEAPWPGDPGMLETAGARIGRSLSIVSVGEAARVDAHSLRVPVVLGDGEGQTSTLMLTIRLDALVDEDGGG